MPSKTVKTLAKRNKKSVDDVERYWKRANDSYKKQQSKAKQGKRKPVRDKDSYVMATVMRQIDRTGPYPHHKRGKSKKKKSNSEEFLNKLDAILEDYYGTQ